jgi:DNA-binding response OmpR family regulator
VTSNNNDAAQYPVCGCCGQEVREVSVDALIVSSKLTATEQTIVEILARANGKVVPVSKIADELYADHPDGGPLCAHGVIYVTIHRLRQKLRKAWVESPLGRNGGYRLIARVETASLGRASLTEKGYRLAPPLGEESHA